MRIKTRPAMGELPEGANRKVGPFYLRFLYGPRGMARALGLKSEGGNAFMKTMQGKGLGSSLPDSLREKIQNPINFKPLTVDLAHGYDADVLADVAKAVVAAADGS